MQFRSTRKYNNEELNLLKKRFIQIQECYINRLKNKNYHLEIPIAIGLKLTNRCNLRCKHCFEWNNDGYHNLLDSEYLSINGDLKFDLIKELILNTKMTSAPIYLWGGEPTVYKHWDELINLLSVEDRKVIICTNGIGLDSKLESISKLRNNVTLLFSIEGFKNEHDYLRGKGSFQKTMESLKLYLTKQRNKEFLGLISVETVISDQLIPHLFEYCNYIEDLGLDTLFLNFPWYINRKEVDKMDLYYEKTFSNIFSTNQKHYSWYSFDFHISPSSFECLKNELSYINKKNWKNHIIVQPNFSDYDEMINYLRGDNIIVGNKNMCLAYSLRIDVMPNGDVIPCKKFPEFVVGNLNESSFNDVWNGTRFNYFREQMNNNLMNICSKCELLYAYGK